jgi:hypothetical protein
MVNQYADFVRLVIEFDKCFLCFGCVQLAHGSGNVLEHGEPQDLEEDGLRHLGPDPPLEEERKGRHEHGGDEVAVHDEDVVVHAVLQGGHGDDVHPREPHLQQHHRHVRLHVAQHLAHAHA